MKNQWIFMSSRRNFKIGRAQMRSRRADQDVADPQAARPRVVVAQDRRAVEELPDAVVGGELHPELLALGLGHRDVEALRVWHLEKSYTDCIYASFLASVTVFMRHF